MIRKKIASAAVALSVGFGGGLLLPDLPDFVVPEHEHPTEYETTKAKEIYHDGHPECEICGVKKSLESKRRNPVHHRIPVATAPQLAATQTNLVTLCIVHHFLVGHGGSYLKYNPDIDSDMKRLKLIYDDIRSRAVKNRKRGKDDR